jgi:hypothetical protein
MAFTRRSAPTHRGWSIPAGSSLPEILFPEKETLSLQKRLTYAEAKI